MRINFGFCVGILYAAIIACGSANGQVIKFPPPKTEPAPPPKPNEYTVPAGQILGLCPETDCDVVDYLSLTPGGQLIDSSATNVILAKAAVFFANKEAVYKVRVVGAKVVDGKAKQEVVILTITVGKPPPAPPGPGPGPVDPPIDPPVTDKLSKFITDAYAADTTPDKANVVSKLASVYLLSPKAVNDTALTTVGQLREKILGVEADLFRSSMPPVPLTAMLDFRTKVGAELDNLLPKESATLLTPELRKTYVDVYARVAAALKGCK